MLKSTEITIADFKAHFTRDFKYASNNPNGCPDDYVTDADLTKAFNEALANFNDGLFDDDTSLQIAFLLLAAHYLSWDLQSAGQGAASTGVFPVVSRTVGSVSETYNVPLWLQHDPVLSAYATTRYGLKYIAIIKPLMIGGIAVYQGMTTP
jgi:hypothetical protein